jgi:hypothetical protein
VCEEDVVSGIVKSTANDIARLELGHSVLPTAVTVCVVAVVVGDLI